MSSDTKWTKQDWLIDRETVYALNAEGTNRFSARVEGGWTTSGRTRTEMEERTANARLIAAAPELYEALDSSIICQLIGEIEDNPSMATAGLWALAVQWMELRDAALAKARGDA